jgi:hypothetical protein
MEITDVKKKKSELREGLVKLLDEFSAETGLKVEEISVDKIYQEMARGGYNHSITVRVEV